MTAKSGKNQADGTCEAEARVAKRGADVEAAMVAELAVLHRAVVATHGVLAGRRSYVPEDAGYELWAEADAVTKVGKYHVLLGVDHRRDVQLLVYTRPAYRGRVTSYIGRQVADSWAQARRKVTVADILAAVEAGLAECAASHVTPAAEATLARIEGERNDS